MPTIFHEVQFPTEISNGAVGGPKFNTIITSTKGGWESRNIAWSETRAEYDVSHAIKDQDDLDALLSFFYARFGQAFAFRFKDWTDYKLVAEGLGSGDTVKTVFNIQKQYNSGGFLFNRRLFKIVVAPIILSTTVFLDGVPQGSGFTIDFNLGTITFSSAPGQDVVVAFTGEFDVPCRFGVDQMKTSLDFFNHFSWNSIPIIEIRIDDGS